MRQKGMDSSSQTGGDDVSCVHFSAEFQSSTATVRWTKARRGVEVKQGPKGLQAENVARV